MRCHFSLTLIAMKELRHASNFWRNAKIKLFSQTFLYTYTVHFGKTFIKRYHQIKWGAMGPHFLTVHFANAFMTNIEKTVLESFKPKHGYEPITWLQFLDDIFCIWGGTQECLLEFLQFCVSFAQNNKFSIKHRIFITF